MFIRFESDGLKTEQQRTVECRSYQTWMADDDTRNIRIDEGEVYNLAESRETGPTS